MDMSLDICFQWCLQYCFLSRSVGADAIRKDAFLVNTNKDFYRGFPISLHAFSVLFKKKTDRGKKILCGGHRHTDTGTDRFTKQHLGRHRFSLKQKRDRERKDTGREK